MPDKKRWIIILIGAIAALLMVSAGSLLIGTKSISILSVFGTMDTGSPEYDILFDIRLPRIFMGLAVGGALSLAGAVLQGVFRNPLVEPYTLGISGGATLGVCLNILTGMSRKFGIISMPLFGFAGALMVILILYTLSVRKGIIKANGLLLTGVMISYISSSILMLIMSMSSTEELHGIIFWTMGSLEEGSWPLIILSLSVSFAGLVVSYVFCIKLNALALGEEEASHLGVNVERTKRIYFLIASALTGLSVSVSGVIAFVGLIVPHILRIFIGGDHRILLAASFFTGAAFLILCDTVARTALSPVEIPVGVITGIIGGCFLLYAISRRRSLWEK